MILAVTGGRDVEPTRDELAALLNACTRRGVRVLRVGDATGVDAAVHRACKALALGMGRRQFALERWCEDWLNRTGNMPGTPKRSQAGNEYWPSAGHARNRAMLTGDPSLARRVECTTCSWGPAHALVCWPGGRGTRDCREQAERLGVRWVVPIGDLKEPKS